MKKIPLLVALSVFTITLKAQDSCTLKDSLLYAQAYNYVIADSVGRTSTIIPANRLATTSYWWFLDELQCSNNSSLKILDEADYEAIPEGLKLSDTQRHKTALSCKIQEFDKNSINHDTKYPQFTFPPSYIDNSCLEYTMYFSQIFHNEFFVELELPPTLMGGGYIYFFVFNPDTTIRFVHRKEIHGL